MTAYIVLIYGILVAAGGVMGYARSRSMPSLISGLLFGILLIGCSAFMLNDDIRATYVALVFSLALSAIFFFRFRVSKRFMPAGLMIILSLAVTVTLAFSVF